MKQEKLLSLANDYMNDEKMKDCPKVFLTGRKLIPIKYILVEFYLYVENQKNIIANLK